MFITPKKKKKKQHQKTEEWVILSQMKRFRLNRHQETEKFRMRESSHAKMEKPEKLPGGS